MRVLVMLDGTPGGTLADPDATHVRVDDLGVTRGDGVFESVLVVDGAPRELDAHLDRLARSAAMLELPVPDRSAWAAAVRTVLAAWPLAGEMAVKLVCTRGPEYGDGGPTAFALGFEVPAKSRRNRTAGVTAVTLERGFDPAIVERAPWLLLGAKTLSYAVNMAANRYAESVGADEVIFIAADNTVLEGPTSTVVLVTDRTLRTPPPTSGVLLGTTQAALFRAAERAGWTTKVEPVDRAELTAADGLFVVSSIRKISRIRALDGVALPDATDLCTELNALYESEY
ncbi:aminodeoxychorismate lyase [Actinokineospora auranticolor]|uniref:4-amino-4-deoxychorismate lyase n=1 Tax=Actinokineospora auranticolor TaxID=155976 RepID=A0A2S6GRD6_9PSEU|nr:aminodeoxychorismate lyase [Actinokineospora auranticolor]PPK67802.1 4-amino-4-deoxychorismate lyase [Actinokineospora auranticolor]